MAPSLETTNNVGNELPLNQEENEEKTYAYAFQLATSCTLPMVLNASIQLGVLQLLHDSAGPNGISASEVAIQLKARNPDAESMLDRMLRLLATHSVVACTAFPTPDGGVERKYRAAPVTKYFVPDESNVCLAPNLSMFVDTVILQTWSKLKEAVLDGGIPFNMVYGMDAFEYCAKDPSFNEAFHKTMCQSTMILREIFAKYKGFDNVRKLVDVGGSVGHTLRAITSQYPFIKAINFDLPHVVKSAPPCPGVEHVGGDMFESVPNGDAIFMKWILHDWSDEYCLKLLKNCYKALPENGKVIVVESIVPDEPQCTKIEKAISQIDLAMMTMHIGGKERSAREFEALAKGAGFAGIKLQCYARGCWVFEFNKLFRNDLTS